MAENHEHRKQDKVRPWLMGLAEGVATAAGQLGAPLKALIKARDEDLALKTDRKLDSLVESQKRIEAAVLKGAISIQGSVPDGLDVIAEALALYLTQCVESVRDPSAVMAMVRKAQGWPFVSVSRVRERDITGELCILYSANMDLLYNDLILTEYDISRLKRTGTPETDVLAFVVSLRGQSPFLVRAVFERLHEKNTSATLTKQVLGDLDAVLAMVQMQE